MFVVIIGYFFFDKNRLSNDSTLVSLGLVNNSVNFLLLCFVVLCLFLPESQTWMTSEGLNLQLLSMHFLI